MSTWPHGLKQQLMANLIFSVWKPDFMVWKWPTLWAKQKQVGNFIAGLQPKKKKFIANPLEVHSALLEKLKVSYCCSHSLSLQHSLCYISLNKLVSYQLLPWPLKQLPPPPLQLLHHLLLLLALDGTMMCSSVFAVLTPAWISQIIFILLWNKRVLSLSGMMKNLSEESIFLQSSWKQ